MRYALSSRFQGGFLGAAIGEILAADLTAHASDAKGGIEVGVEIDLWGLQSAIAESSAPRWGKVAIDQMRRLTSNPLALSEPLSEPLAKSPISLAGLAIALLPLAFFYHEDINLLNWQVQQKLAQWQLPPELGMGAIGVGYAISLILQERFQPLNLIPQLLAEMPEPKHAALIDQLTQVQGWLTEEAIASQFSAHKLSFVASSPISTISVSPETIPLALAFYTFLSTPEDFRLSLLRVAQFPGQVAQTCSLACSLTAALSGTHNGRGGLPPSWRKALRNVPERRSPLSLLWDVESEADLLECIDRFMSAWSGMHSPMRHNLRSRTPVAVALPRSIRPT